MFSVPGVQGQHFFLPSFADGTLETVEALKLQQNFLQQKIVNCTSVLQMLNTYIITRHILSETLPISDKNVRKLIAFLACPIVKEYLLSRRKLLILDTCNHLHAFGKRRYMGYLPANVKRRFDSQYDECLKYFATVNQLLILLTSGRLYVFGGVSDLKCIENDGHCRALQNDFHSDSIKQPRRWLSMKFWNFEVEDVKIKVDNRKISVYRVRAYVKNCVISFIIRKNFKYAHLQ